MSREKPKFFARITPWVGATLVIMGLTQAGLTYLDSGELDLRALGTGLLIAGGGTSLMKKRSSGGRFFVFLASAIAISGALLGLATRT